MRIVLSKYWGVGGVFLQITVFKYYNKMAMYNSKGKETFMFHDSCEFPRHCLCNKL